jgi:hypothetical protein
MLCKKFWNNDDICLRQRIRSFFCHQMRKSSEICKNLGFCWLPSLRVTSVNWRLGGLKGRQPVKIATSESLDFHIFRYSSASSGRQKERIFCPKQISNNQTIKQICKSEDLFSWLKKNVAVFCVNVCVLMCMWT